MVQRMLQRMWERRREDRGFTLIELLVVVLIIGILIAIAIPTFFGAQESAEEAAAKADLRNAATAAKVYYASDGDGSYVGFDATAAAVIEPGLPWDLITISNAGADTVTFTKAFGDGLTCELAVTADALTFGQDCLEE